MTFTLHVTEQEQERGQVPNPLPLKLPLWDHPKIQLNRAMLRPASLTLSITLLTRQPHLVTVVGVGLANCFLSIKA